MPELYWRATGFFRNSKGHWLNSMFNSSFWRNVDSKLTIGPRKNPVPEIDFLIQNEMSIVPIEVKAEVNLQAKSLKFYCLKFRPPVAIRTSMGKYYKQTISFSETSDVHASEGYTLIDLPLYGISRIQQECAMISE